MVANLAVQKDHNSVARTTEEMGWMKVTKKDHRRELQQVEVLVGELAE
jgi:hypothetical protein